MGVAGKEGAGGNSEFELEDHTTCVSNKLELPRVWLDGREVIQTVCRQVFMTLDRF